MEMWNQLSIKPKVTMYSKRANLDRKDGMSEWEVKYCLWWIDFKEDECPPSEISQYQLHEKGRLALEEGGEAMATEMASRSVLDNALEKLNIVPINKGKKKVPCEPEEEDASIAIFFSNGIP
ncbi:hypothetical protein O6H91_Y505500 [Diphasiastrum complanatum]|nr:hypothetical protein O6H91_Y505500 [Diphasiastrum complanatum]